MDLWRAGSPSSRSEQDRCQHQLRLAMALPARALKMPGMERTQPHETARACTASPPLGNFFPDAQPETFSLHFVAVAPCCIPLNHLSLSVASLPAPLIHLPSSFQLLLSSLCCFSLPIRPRRLTDTFEDFGYHSSQLVLLLC